MIKLELKGKEYELKNSLNEITTGVFCKVSEAFANDKYTTVDKYLNSFRHLGLDEEVVGSIGTKALLQIIKQMRLGEKVENLQKEIELPSGRKLQIFEGEEYDMPAGLLSKLESGVKSSKKNIEIISDILNYYSDEKITLEEVEDTMASYTAPFLAWLQINITDNINSLLNEAQLENI
jgi:hypothetical protein